MILAILAFTGFAHAQQDVKLVNPDTFCKIEVFAAQKGKTPSGNYKKCDALKDKAEVQVKSMSECKQRALAKGEECLKAAGSEDLGVTGKFIEKFSVSFNATSFTCAVSRGAGNICP